jgi:leucine-rich PPR motif-containing protein
MIKKIIYCYKLISKYLLGGAIGLLMTGSSDIDSQFEKIARKYADHQILGPVNVLWIHYFVSGNQQKTDQLWKEYLSASPRLMFHRIIQEGREKENPEMVNKLISYLNNGTSISEGAIGNVYSSLIDIYASKKDVPALLDSLKKAVDSVCLENINTTALNRAKECIESAGQKFPYKIPEKKSKKQQDNSSSSSSSSSSDDEVTKKA